MNSLERSSSALLSNLYKINLFCELVFRNYSSTLKRLSANFVIPVKMAKVLKKRTKLYFTELIDMDLGILVG